MAPKCQKTGVQRNHWWTKRVVIVHSKFLVKVLSDPGYYFWPTNVCEIACYAHRFVLVYNNFFYLKNKTNKILCWVLSPPIPGRRPGILLNQYGLQFHYLYQYLFYWCHRIVWPTDNMLSLTLEILCSW